MNTDIEQARHAAMEKYGTDIDKLQIKVDQQAEIIRALEEINERHMGQKSRATRHTSAL